MTNEVHDFGPQGCPYLGLEEDRSVMLLEASPLHRCYAVPKENHTPPLEYQAQTCLCEAHHQCPRFQRAAPLGDVVKPPPRAPARKEPRTPMILAGVATLLVLAAIGWLAASFLGLGMRNTEPQTEIVLADTGATPAVTAPTDAAASGAASGAGSGQSGASAPSGDTDEAQATQTNTAPVDTANPDTANPDTADSDTGDPATAGGANADMDAAGPTAEVEPVAAAPVDEPTPTPTPNAEGANQGISLFNIITPTPLPGAEVFRLRPSTSNAGWWIDSDPTQGNLNDSFLYSGALGGATYIGAARFDLSRIPRGAPLLTGSLTLTGLRDEQLDRNAPISWLVQLIGENELAELVGSNFMMVYSAPAAITLLPQLAADQVGVDVINTYALDSNALRWLEQMRLDGATSVVVRILPNTDTANTALFGWDSGLGAISKGNGPLLELAAGPGPTATPPLPTREFVVATFTPVPANVLTVEAEQQIATAVAATTGTYTPMPYFVTPTPQPQNLATVQAAALVGGLPPVVLETPVPANEATATEQAAYATAVAATTGTFTPVPTGYVTPFLVLPSPPADNLLTVVARSADATAIAQQGGPTATPLPHNAVIAAYVVATVTPGNVATAAAVVQEATAAANLIGTATPTPWEWVVITPTRVPQEAPPTSTPTLPPLILERDFTPTPTPLPGATEPVPASLPPEFLNKIIFRSNRTGVEEIFLIDPATGDAGKVTRSWVYPMAQEQLAVSPDGKKVAVVKPDTAGVLQIFVRSLEFGTDTQITTFDRDSYDPTWSPTGEWIAFVGTNTGNDEIYRVSPDGATVQQLTFNSFEWDKHPTWSPDGSQIVFFSNRETGRRQLWIMNVDGSGQRNYSSNAFEDWDPIWTR
jgi:hypothetical protein